jgi:putative peptidoglycan lipid II flippase
MNTSAISITLFNLFARGFHLVLFLSIGNRFGADITTDSVFFLQSPLLVLISVIAGSAETVIMPSMHRAFQANCPNALIRVFIRQAFVFVFPTTFLVLFLFAQMREGPFPLLIIIFLSPIPLLAALSSIKMGILNSEGKYRRATLGPLYGSILSLPVLAILPKSSHSLAFVLLLFELGRALGLWLHTEKRKQEKDHENTTAKDIISWAVRNAKLQAIGSFLLALNPLVDVLFASHIGSGALTKVEYANRLWNIIPLLLSGPLILTYAGMSLSTSRGLRLDYKRVHTRAFVLAASAALLSLAGILASRLIIDILYGFGQMNPTSRTTLANLLACYLIGAGPLMGGLVYVRALSSEGRIRPITITAGINVIANIVLNIALIRAFGLNGIGLATSLTYVSSLILLSYFFTRQKWLAHRRAT